MATDQLPALPIEPSGLLHRDDGYYTWTKGREPERRPGETHRMPFFTEVDVRLAIAADRARAVPVSYLSGQAATAAGEREAFEAWLRNSDDFLPEYLCRLDMAGSARFGEYCQSIIEYQWQAWQARASLSTPASGEGWKRIVDAAEAVTTGGIDRIDHFEVPSHLMAALALALDEVHQVASPTSPTEPTAEGGAA